MFSFSTLLSNVWETISGHAKTVFMQFASQFASDALDAVKESAQAGLTGQEAWDVALGKLISKVEASGWRNAQGFAETVLQNAYQTHALAQGNVATPPAT